MLMMDAFDVQMFQIRGGPAWVNDVRYDIIAIPPASSSLSKLVTPNRKLPPSPEEREMLQALLMDRFQLKYHRVQVAGPVYELVKGKCRLNLQEAKNKADFPWAGAIGGGMITGNGIAGINISMTLLATRLSRYLERPVLDRTGLTGSYDFRYEYSSLGPDQDVISCIFASVKGIGLELKPGKGLVESIVIDHVETPSEN
jgi:uncharacterized protein (TIGR03435 family)